MPPVISDPGPSKRVSTFKGSDEEPEEQEEDIEELVTKRKNKKLANGDGSERKIKRAKVANGHVDGIVNGARGDKRGKMRERAEELFEMRQELPFYQGEFYICSSVRVV
jgi:hypothetical protein